MITPPRLEADAALLLSLLRSKGPLRAAELAQRLGKSQPTISRLLGALSHAVVVLGQGRSTRYAAPQPILGLPARQPLHWVHNDGRIETWGELTLLANGQLHVQAAGIDHTGTDWPWFLSPLRAHGFLGRLLARQLASHGLEAQPERWSLEQSVFAALRLHDAPGALHLGQPTPQPLPQLITPDDADRLANDVAATLPAGSFAGGEQAKFLAQAGDGTALLVKFSPPRGTPFGERWHELLVAEHHALTLLAEHGVPVAPSALWHTAQRTYLLSTRFDRLRPQGRRHVVAIDAWHQAFVPGPRQHWAATCTELARQRRVPPEVPAQAAALLHFGRLIGNTDMHFGNLSLLVQPDQVATGRGTLAPVYDMLPMRWRPDPVQGQVDLTPFTPDPIDLQSPARPLARDYWHRLIQDPALSAEFHRLARAMRDHLGR